VSSTQLAVLPSRTAPGSVKLSLEVLCKKVVEAAVTFITAKHQIGEATQRAGAMRGASIVVGDGAWVGANATILPGVSVGRGAVVAAGAVVSRDVPPNVIVAGVPAKIKIELS
jgi:maltose O-acetyltransferase